MCPTSVHEPVEVIGSPGTRITSSYEAVCICWELNPSLLQGQQVFLTAEPSLYPKWLYILDIKSILSSIYIIPHRKIVMLIF